MRTSLEGKQIGLEKPRRGIFWWGKFPEEKGRPVGLQRSTESIHFKWISPRLKGGTGRTRSKALAAVGMGGNEGACRNEMHGGAQGEGAREGTNISGNVRSVAVAVTDWNSGRVEEGS